MNDLSGTVRRIFVACALACVGTAGAASCNVTCDDGSTCSIAEGKNKVQRMEPGLDPLASLSYTSVSRPSEHSRIEITLDLIDEAESIRQRWPQHNVTPEMAQAFVELEQTLAQGNSSALRAALTAVQDTAQRSGDPTLAREFGTLGVSCGCGDDGGGQQATCRFTF
jgi:hypothetical protein